MIEWTSIFTVFKAPHLEHRLWMDGWRDSYLAWTFQGSVCSKILCVSLISQRFQLGKDMIKSLKCICYKP